MKKGHPRNPHPPPTPTREDTWLEKKEIKDPTAHAVFFDNYFTCYDLLVKLKEKRFKVTGTLRENRVGKPPLPSSKEPKNSLEVIMKTVFHLPIFSREN